MTRRRRAAAPLRLWLRFAATIAAWVLIIVYVHRLAHMYQSEIVEVLKSSLLQILATTVLITSLIYLIALSLPFVPNPRPRTIGMVFLWATLLVAGHSLSHMGFHDAQVMLSTMQEAVDPLTLVLLAIAYAVALAMPNRYELTRPGTAELPRRDLELSIVSPEPGCVWNLGQSTFTVV